MQLPPEFLCISSSILLLLLPTLSLTLPSPSPSSLLIDSLPPSTLLPLPSPSSSPNITSASNGRCAPRSTFPTWYARNWLVEDCYAALQQLYLKETMLHPNQEFEFLQPGASRQDLDIPWQKTPRKYVVNTCTLTIMLLSWFGPGSLPSPPFPITSITPSDTSTYAKIWAAGRRLEEACPDEAGAGGWCAVGDKNAMGVFIWATDSAINSRVRGVPIVELMNGNVSTVGDAVGVGQTS